VRSTPDLVDWALTPPGPTSTGSTSTAAVGTGMLTLTVEPDDGYRSVGQLIASARHTIDMTMYELADTEAQGLLIAARQRGVAIRVLLDHAYSGASVDQAAHPQLEGAGVPVRWAADAVIFHQKTITVDGAVSAVMTGNLTAQHYGTTRDFVVTDRDPTAVAAVEAGFDRDWNALPRRPGGEVPQGGRVLPCRTSRPDHRGRRRPDHLCRRRRVALGAGRLTGSADDRHRAGRADYSTSRMASAALTDRPAPGSTLSVVTTPSSMTMA
jgi:hypothetical protein